MILEAMIYVIVIDAIALWEQGRMQNIILSGILICNCSCSLARNNLQNIFYVIFLYHRNGGQAFSKRRLWEACLEEMQFSEEIEALK